MAFDWFAVVSNGTYPTPTPPTATQRAAYAVSYGLLSLIEAATATARRGLSCLGFSTRLK